MIQSLDNGEDAVRDCHEPGFFLDAFDCRYAAACRSLSKAFHSALEDLFDFLLLSWSLPVRSLRLQIVASSTSRSTSIYFRCVSRSAQSRKKTKGAKREVNERGCAASEETYLHRYSFLQILSPCQSRSSGYSDRILRIRKTCLLRRSCSFRLWIHPFAGSRERGTILNEIVLIKIHKDLKNKVEVKSAK